MGDINYNRIISNAAGQILKPSRLFQKGRSRIWIDDNGWYITIVEFQPSGHEKGTYLNVAMHYLWSDNNHFTFDYGGREHEFIAFTDDEDKIYNDILNLSKQALKKVCEYRKFSDISYAKKKIVSREALPSTSHELYNKMMIRGLAMDEKAQIYINMLLKELENFKLPYEAAYYLELTEKILPIAANKVEFYEYIMKKIANKRAFWRGKDNMKKLPIDEIYS